VKDCTCAGFFFCCSLILENREAIIAIDAFDEREKNDISESTVDDVNVADSESLFKHLSQGEQSFFLNGELFLRAVVSRGTELFVCCAELLQLVSMIGGTSDEATATWETLVEFVDKIVRKSTGGDVDGDEVGDDEKGTKSIHISVAEVKRVLEQKVKDRESFRELEQDAIRKSLSQTQ